ncbi:carbohydrate esterase family 9 protein [Lepidopterella palustris CBS 459.81]|uniref:Carbohydrate esterase family 9 protein n=1 Tax=Lepidopterella palustris CBS 459.81 TaxID=1314670 RepID=A0A8E2E5E6_9PEZI|nr:carbohydrate esterase family 9 protein [Lepidopterella palustris CBS 459.81]
MSAGWFTTFTNCRYCLNGELVDDHLVISDEKGTILRREGYIGGEIVDLEDAIIAPGFLELQTNGVNGFHFTHFVNETQYERKLEETARYYVTQGVTGFWATIPTVAEEEFKKILPSLTPRPFPSAATLLGAHTEGPYLHPSKKGAHNASLFHPCTTPPTTIYGPAFSSAVKLVTLAPELPSSCTLIQQLTSMGIRVSLGHSNATYSQGLSALSAGATSLTHTLNAMSPLQSREPGLAGLISLPLQPLFTPPSISTTTTTAPRPPFFTQIPDSHHVHPRTLSLLHNSSPTRSILITDSIELLSLPDGLYPGHSQIPFPQSKSGTRATIAGTETLIGGCITLQQGVRNLRAWTGCGIAEAVSTVTENVARLMGVDGVGGQGVLIEGRKADLAVLSEEGEVLQTWVAGRKVWDREEALAAKEETGGEVTVAGRIDG